MKHMKKLAATLSTVRLGIAIAMLTVIAMSLHNIDSDLKSAKDNLGPDVAVADGRRVDVPIGQTIVMPRGDKLTSMHGPVVVYSCA